MPISAYEDFLNVANQFKLGTLETEKPHPLTVNLSKESQSDLPAAVNTLKQVDTDALQKMGNYLPEISRLGRAIQDTLADGGRIFLCGCGATGRLSISLEVFCRSGLVPSQYKDRFIGFMAGGDAALIKSIENFEDYPDYGQLQLLELNFEKNDLLISTTEGGETPFVIGATEAAISVSRRRPWFLYCNPKEQMVMEVQRSAKVINNEKIESLSLYVGPMGLSGSTRMQASTVLMAAVGWAIKHGDNLDAIHRSYETFKSLWLQLDLHPLVEFTHPEALSYKNGEYVIYQTNDYGVTVLTDTTERSPTFSLPPFENAGSPSDVPGWCYLSLPSTKDSTAAWEALLKREPRCLEWGEIKSFTGEEFLNNFYISQDCPSRRALKTHQAIHHIFSITSISGHIRFFFKGKEWDIPARDLGVLEENLLLKLILNIHSTLVMGILDRFESNLMTFVKPTNFKLIDRTIRYVQLLSEIRGQAQLDYCRIAAKLFEIKDELKPDEPVVIRILEAMQDEDLDAEILG